MRVRWLGRSIALAGALAVVAVACGGGPGPSPTAPGGSPTGPAPTETTPPQGGEVVFGAEQWPECTNPITSCSTAAWAIYSVFQHVLPRLMQLDPQGNFVASPLVTEAPTLENGLLEQGPPFKITYNLNPDATWDDGSPITSEDIEFSWKAIMNTTGTATTVGYADIESIDTTDPKTAVITFSKVFSDWPDLFGGAFGGFYKKAAFPNADPDKPDLEKEMLEGIPFSGGPWILESWSMDQAVFVRNDNYYGTVANFDQVTFVPRLDQSTEINSLLTGEVSAIFPQPSDVSLLDQVASDPNVNAVGGNGVFFEAIWINHASPPLDDPMVRQALMFAIDRQSVIDAIIKLNNPDATVLNCGFISHPDIGPWCDQTYFDEFTYDPDMARSILEGDGYDCSTEGQACTKDGKPLQIQYSTVATNTRRTTTQELLKDKALAAGIDFKVKNYDAGVLFGDIGPKGKFEIADYAQSISPDPTVTSVFGCDEFPTEENSFSGSNWNRWCDPQATDLMKQADQQLDVQARLDLMNQVYALEAQDFVSLPLYILPTVGAWRTDKIDGPIDTYLTSLHGLFFNMNEWFLAQG